MTPRQLAVEQLLSHKLNGLPSQQASVIRPQSVDTISAVNFKSPEAGPSAGQDVHLNGDHTGDHSVALPGGLQVLKLQSCVVKSMTTFVPFVTTFGSFILAGCFSCNHALPHNIAWLCIAWLCIAWLCMLCIELHCFALHCIALHCNT